MALSTLKPAIEHIDSSEDETQETETYKDSALVELVSIIPCRLQMAIMTKAPMVTENDNFYLFSSDDQLLYANFYQDFGPLNLSKLYHFCMHMNKALQQEGMANKVIIYYTCKDPKMILNAAFLIGSYSLIYLRFSVQAVMKALGPILRYANGLKYCDASINDLAYLSLKDCLSGVYKAVQRNFFNFDDFNAHDYDYYECVENGDLNWIVPDKLLAFCGPNYRTVRTKDSVMHGPDVYIDYFKKHNVTTVVRLNSAKYDAHDFTKHGIQHFDLYFADGTAPCDRLAKQFLKICENAKGAVAIHCKAGLGRTGTLIAAYLIKHYMLTAMEAVAWIRICRPGSVIGQQQTWLVNKQSMLLQEGEAYRKQRQNRPPLPAKHARGVYSHHVDIIDIKEETPSAQPASPKPTPTPAPALAPAPANDVENVQRISQRVDTMCLNDGAEQTSDRVDVASQVNNNVVHCKPTRIKKVAKLTSRYIRGNRLNGGRTIVTTTTTTTTTTVRRGRANANSPPVDGTQPRASLQETHVSRKKTTVTSRQPVPVRTEVTTAPSVPNERNAATQNASQGDQLNSIKAARRQHAPTDAVQQAIRNRKLIVPSPPKKANVPEHGIQRVKKVQQGDKVKDAKKMEPVANPPIMITMPQCARSSDAIVSDQRARHIAPTQTVVGVGIGESTLLIADQCVPVTRANEKQSHLVESIASQCIPLPSINAMRIPTRVKTSFSNCLQMTYMITLDLNTVLGNLFDVAKMDQMEPMAYRRNDTQLRVSSCPDSFTNMYNFDVRISNLYREEKISPTAPCIFAAPARMETTSATSATTATPELCTVTKIVSPRYPVLYRPTQRAKVVYLIPAKLLWVLDSKAKLSVRVTFDYCSLNNILPSESQPFQVPPVNKPVEREFNVEVEVTRLPKEGISIATKMNVASMRQKCEETKRLTTKNCQSWPECPDGNVTNRSLVAFDCNRNNASTAKQPATKPKPIKKQDPATAATTVNNNAESDNRPNKRLRVELSRV